MILHWASIILMVTHAVACTDDAPLPGVRAVAFSPDGKLLAVTTGEPHEPGTLTVYATTTWRPQWRHAEKSGIPAVAFSADSKALAISVFEDTARIIDAASGKVRSSFGKAKEVRAVAFSPDGTLLASGGLDRKVRLWEVRTGQEWRVMGEHSDRVYTVSFSPDGRRLVSAGGNEIKLWKTAPGAEIRTWNHDRSLARCALFSPDGRFVITGGWDGTVRIWNAASGDLLLKFHNLGGVEAVAFSPTTRTLAVCTIFKSFYLFDLTLDEPTVEDRDRVHALLARLDEDSYDAREKASKELLEAGFVAEPQLRQAMTDAKSTEVRIRARRVRAELLSRPKAELSGHTGDVQTLAFSPDGKTLASGSKDGTVCLWDVATRKEIGRLRMATDIGR